MPATESTSRKFRLDDTTVIVPYKEDSADRRRNITIVLDYFRRFFEGHRVLLMEQGAVSSLGPLLNGHPGIDHVTWPLEGAFHKSRILNLAIAMAETPCCLLFDADVLLHPAALDRAVALLRDGDYDFVLPFNRAMVQIRRELIDPGLTVDEAFLDGLPVCGPGEAPGDPRCERLYGEPGDPCVGGALMFSRRAMIRHGGYNPNIVSYSCEDVELYSRLEILGARLTSLDGFCCYHLEHRRGTDSRYNNFHGDNLAEWLRVRAMDRERLWRYVHNGFKHLVPAPHGEYTISNTESEYAVRLIETGRTPLDSLTLAIFTARPSDDDVAALKQLLDEMDRRFVNHEVMLFEAGGERCRALHLGHQLVYYRLSAAERRVWRDLATAHSRRRFLALADLSRVEAAAMPQMIQHWVDDGQTSGSPAVLEGVELVFRPIPGAGARPASEREADG